MTTKFKARFLPLYHLEIFGNAENLENLLSKNLSQKTKYNLKKLGVKLQNEYKSVTEQAREIFNKYAEDVPNEKLEELEDKSLVANGKQVPLNKQVDFQKEIQDLEEMDIEIEHPTFTESDFIDRSTGEIVAGKMYYNLIDLLLWEGKDE